MGMRLRFLGTGPAVGIPRPGHTDPACLDALAGGKSRRRRSAALVERHGATLLIDAGPDIEAQLEEAKPKRLDAVFLTHGHADASGGLHLLNHWAARQPGRTKLPLFTDTKTAARLAKRTKPLGCLQIITFSPFDRIEVGPCRIVPFPVEHATEGGWPTHGYVFDERLAYASDLYDIPKQSQALLWNIPAFVIDGTFFFGRKVLPSHLATDEAVEWGIKLGVKKLILTQIGHTYPPHDQAESKLATHLKALPGKKPETFLAYDGLKLAV